MRIVLVGLPGSGKTTVAKQVADKLSLSVYDTDALLVEKTGVSVSAIFEIEGECGFRLRETRVLSELLDSLEAKAKLSAGHAGFLSVIATGGGVVVRPENRLILKKMGRVVYLHTHPDLILLRLKQDKNRPLIRATANLPDLINKMYDLRDPLYREIADDIIDCRGGALSEVLKRIEHFFNKQ